MTDKKTTAPAATAKKTQTTKKFRRKFVTSSKLTMTIHPYVNPTNGVFLKKTAKKFNVSYSVLIDGIIQKMRTGKAVSVNGHAI